MKNLVLVFVALFAWACSEGTADETPSNTDSLEQSNSPAPETTSETTEQEPAPEETNEETITKTYRSDQARPGVTAEFMKVEYSSDNSEVVGLWYWTDRDPEPMKLELQKSEHYTGEEEGNRGVFRFPGDKKDSKFLIAEGMIDVTYADGNRQSFTLEG